MYGMHHTTLHRTTYVQSVLQLGRVDNFVVTKITMKFTEGVDSTLHCAGMLSILAMLCCMPLSIFYTRDELTHFSSQEPCTVWWSAESYTTSRRPTLHYTIHTQCGGVEWSGSVV